MSMHPTLTDPAVVPTDSVAATTASDLIAQAGTLFQNKDYAGALAALDKALTLAPEHPLVPLLKGNVLYHLNDLEGALGQFMRVTTQDPNYAQAQASAAALLKQLGRLEEAEQMILKSLKLDPTDLEALKFLGNLCLQRGRLAEAVSAYTAVLREQPTDIESCLCQARCYFDLGKFPEATARYQQVLALQPDHALAKENLQIVQQKMSAESGPNFPTAQWAKFVKFKERAASKPALTYDQIKQRKIELVAGIGRASSLRDFGGLGGGDGLYLLEGVKALGCTYAEMIDATPREQFDLKVAELRKQMPVDIRMTRADFRDPQLYRGLQPVEVSLLFEVLLHQDNTVEVIKNVARTTTGCVCVAQPVIKEDLFALPNAAVNLQFYSEELKDLLRYAGWWHKEPAAERFETRYWMWGQTVSYLKSIFYGYGWAAAFEDRYQASEHWEYALLRFVRRRTS